MENIINFMTFCGCIAIVILAIWGTLLGIQIVIETLKVGHISGIDATILMISLSSILLAVVSVSNYWEKIEQDAVHRNGVESKIRQNEKDFDKKMDSLMQDNWKKVE